MPRSFLNRALSDRPPVESPTVPPRLLRMYRVPIRLSLPYNGGSFNFTSSTTSTSTLSLQALLQTLLAELEALIQKLNTQLVSSFTRNLTIGSQGQDVKNLQMFLNDNGYIIAQSGAGSPGNEVSYFGQKTQQALAKFQKASGLPASGFLGAMTRAYLEKRW